jgi:Protein of unknown function/Domain of unknown function (DUF1835)
MNDMRVLHVTIAGSAAGNVRELIKGREFDQMLSVEDCFSVGPLLNITEANGLRARENYLRIMLEKIHHPSLFEEVGAHIGIVDLRRLTKDIRRIVVWCGANANEQILLRAVCANSPDIPLTVVDISTMNSRNKKRSAIGGSNLAELAVAEQNAVLLSVDARKRLSAEWEKLIRGHDLLRIFLDGQVKGVDETFFDPMLIDLCPEEFGSAARLVGEVMGQSQIQIGDTFLDYRLRVLIANGAVDARHADKQLRFMEVRHRRSSSDAKL